MARLFENFPTFLIYFKWNLMYTIIHILVLSLLVKELFFKGRNTVFFLSPYVEFIAIELSLILLWHHNDWIKFGGLPPPLLHYLQTSICPTLFKTTLFATANAPAFWVGVIDKKVLHLPQQPRASTPASWSIPAQ